MPVGINPGIYVDIIPEVFTPIVGGAATYGLFFLFSQKGEDNKIVNAVSNVDVLKKFGIPNLSKYGQGLYNAYNFSRVSSNGLIHRTLPNIEDTPTSGYPDPNYIQMPATFANTMFAVIDANHATDNKLLIPVSLIPPQLKDNPNYLDSVYNNETEEISLKDTDGSTFAVTKSTTVFVDYYGEYTNVNTAGYFNNSATMYLDYPAVRNSLQELGFYNSSDPYIQNFLSSGPVTTLTITPGSVPIPPIVNRVTITPTAITNTLDLTGTGLENLSNFLVYVNGNFVDPTLITWASPNLTLPFNVAPTDTVEIVGVVLNNMNIVSGGNNITLPPNSYVKVVDINGVVDFGGLTHSVYEDPNTGNIIVTNLDPTNQIYVFHDTTVGNTGTYLIDLYTSLNTYDDNGQINYTLTINPDIVANSLGYAITVYVDGKPVPFNYNMSTNEVNVSLLGTPGNNVVITVKYIQVNDANAVVQSKLAWGIHAKGRGGWYNKLAFQIQPNFEETSTQFLPNPRFYSMSFFMYDSRVGDYMPIEDRFEFNVNHNGLDDFGRKADLETLANTYGNDIFVYQNREYLEILEQQAPVDSRYGNRWEEIVHKTFKQIAGQYIKLKGGAEGCVRRVDGFIYWPIATSILMKAIQGLYDQDLYNLDKILIDVVFDADYPDAVKKELVNLCEIRQDCVAILDVPKYPNVDSVTTWHDNFGLSSMLAAVYTPHMKIFSQFDNDYIWFAPSYVLSFMVPFVDKTYGFWQPIAGKTRGNIRFDIQRYGINIPLTENSADHRKLVLRQINPLGRKQGTHVVWGNYTTYKIPSALQSLHASRITVRIYRDLRTALNAVLWDLMTPTLRSQIKNLVLNVLSNYIGTAIEADVSVDVQYTDYDRQQRMARVYVSFRPFLELRRVYLLLNVR